MTQSTCFIKYLLIDTINQGYIHCKYKVSTSTSKVKWVTTSICLTIFNNILLYNLLCYYYYCKIASGRVARSRLSQYSSPSTTQIFKMGFHFRGMILREGDLIKPSITVGHVLKLNIILSLSFFFCFSIFHKPGSFPRMDAEIAFYS